MEWDTGKLLKIWEARKQDYFIPRKTGNQVSEVCLNSDGPTILKLELRGYRISKAEWVITSRPRRVLNSVYISLANFPISAAVAY